MRSVFRLAVAASAALILATPAALAQPSDYPNRPIRLFVGFPPGGAADLVARLIADSMSRRLGQPIVIDNRPGSGSNLAGAAAAKSPADGYTLLHAADNMIATNPHLYAKMPFDTRKDLVPLASLLTNQYVLTVNPALPVKTVQDLIDLARKSDKPLFYASIGLGSTHHLAMEVLKQETGIPFTHVPYRGGGAAATAVMANDVQAMFGAASVVPTVLSGKVRGIAVSGSKRWSMLPDLPPVGETVKGFDMTVWHAWFAPAGTPEPIVERLHKELNEVLKEPAIVEQLHKSGSGDPYITTREEFRQRIDEDYERYRKLIKSLGLKID